jgi:hypothetical protein
MKTKSFKFVLPKIKTRSKVKISPSKIIKPKTQYNRKKIQSDFFAYEL